MDNDYTLITISSPLSGRANSFSPRCSASSSPEISGVTSNVSIVYRPLLIVIVSSISTSGLTPPSTGEISSVPSPDQTSGASSSAIKIRKDIIIPTAERPYSGFSGPAIRWSTVLRLISVTSFAASSRYANVISKRTVLIPSSNDNRDNSEGFYLKIEKIDALSAIASITGLIRGTSFPVLTSSDYKYIHGTHTRRDHPVRRLGYLLEHILVPFHRNQFPSSHTLMILYPLLSSFDIISSSSFFSAHSRFLSSYLDMKEL